MDLDFELLMTNIRAQVHEYIDNVLVKCCKEYNLSFHEVRQKVGLFTEQEERVEAESVVCENTVSKKPAKKPRRTVDKPMCTALTRNGEPCKSKAADNETCCKKHLLSMQKKKDPVVAEQKRKTPKKKPVAAKPAVEVTVNDLPKDEAEWLVNNEEPKIGTIAPDLSMTESYFPADVLYEEEDIIDDVSESDYVLDE